ncbi:MAG TPA: hypothetical protein VMR50_04135 [Myxococcota bacterium]|nr:hypothetical protein [Myxococcota bacterium]
MAGEKFDQVTIRGSAGGERRMGPSEFAALPINERVSAVLQKRLKFYLNGVEVPEREALKPG